MHSALAFRFRLSASTCFHVGPSEPGPPFRAPVKFCTIRSRVCLCHGTYDLGSSAEPAARAKTSGPQGRADKGAGFGTAPALVVADPESRRHGRV